MNLTLISNDSGCGNVGVDGHTELDPELFPASDADVDEVDGDEVDELEELSKVAMSRAARRVESKAKATKARKLKQKIAAGTTKEDAYVISDSCSSDIKGITDSSDDDGVELISQRCVLKKKSRAKALKDMKYYDDKKNKAHEQLEVDMYFVNVREVRKAIEDYHIKYTRNFTSLKNNQERVVACCSSSGTCSFMFISVIKGETTHCIRQLNLSHTCGTNTETSRINSSWIAKKYEDLIRSDPSINISVIQDNIMREHG
ncbi:uncharacterized protein LOC104584523 [Brachypodium distachyon]|uniref:uncharacterized protein LOC104584523 n=1 Tax=Brachypodium distachyon TaxID=15368 RepID=UPI00052FE606|nr:uncharacterized protein LOC104584523 [Brachypodium distachyon]|eukprot:XP_010237628.1 uncharacterized protein LOC104584523 [Brachypodium distachyon]